MVFRMGGHLATGEKWLCGNAVVKVANAYNYLGLIFTTKLSVSAALSDLCRKVKQGVMEKQKSLRILRSMFLLETLRRSDYSYLDVCSRRLGIT